MKTAELLLHPVRLRIIQEMLGRDPLTTSELREAMPDVPVATLYRQVAALVEGNVLETVDERRIRGAIERTYALRHDGTEVDPQVLRKMSPDEHRQAFIAFVASLLRDFDQYLDQEGGFDVVHDGVGYRQAALWLSDDEFVEFADGFAKAVIPFLQNEPAPGRRLRVFTTVVLPLPDDGESD